MTAEENTERVTVATADRMNAMVSAGKLTAAQAADCYRQYREQLTEAFDKARPVLTEGVAVKISIRTGR